MEEILKKILETDKPSEQFKVLISSLSEIEINWDIDLVLNTISEQNDFTNITDHDISIFIDLVKSIWDNELKQKTAKLKRKIKFDSSQTFSRRNIAGGNYFSRSQVEYNVIYFKLFKTVLSELSKLKDYAVFEEINKQIVTLNSHLKTCKNKIINADYDHSTRHKTQTFKTEEKDFFTFVILFSLIKIFKPQLP